MSEDTKKTILLVEDDEETSESLRELLEEHGYRVLQGRNGQDAQEKLRGSARPDCILLDLWMPGKDGWTFASELKEGGLGDIPLVVITAAEPHWGYPAPPARVMRKPLDSERLLRLVGTLARNERVHSGDARKS
ncbi:MAG TPA: response regulator [Polyangia bacterium]|nr:response regulator [Polyangia bacterium]